MTNARHPLEGRQPTNGTHSDIILSNTLRLKDPRRESQDIARFCGHDEVPSRDAVGSLKDFQGSSQDTAGYTKDFQGPLQDTVGCSKDFQGPSQNTRRMFKDLRRILEGCSRTFAGYLKDNIF